MGRYPYQKLTILCFMPRIQGAAREIRKMNVVRIRLLGITAAIVLTLPAALAQSTDPGAKQDMKDAGHDTKHAVTSTGHGIAHGTEKGYDKTKSGTEKGYDKTKSGTEKGYDKTKSGTEKGYDKTKAGTKKVYHKTAHTTKTGVHKVEGKPDTPENNPPR
jgi:hypothetical protein